MTEGADVIRLEKRRTRVGIAEHFRVGERERAERLLDDLSRLRVRDLRVGVSWADWCTPEGERFYAWLLPRLTSRLRVVPCLCHTPPSLGVEPSPAAPPRRPEAFADWLEEVLERFGRGVEWVELWSAPNDLASWDRRLDPGDRRLVRLLSEAATRARARGVRPVLGGLRPVDPSFLAHLAALDVLSRFDAVGVHLLPGLSEPRWHGWAEPVAAVRRALEAHGPKRAQVWITEGGFSTWQHDEGRQHRELVEALEAGADRLYWLGMYDLPEHASTTRGFHEDEREYHFGLKRSSGEPKLAFRLWADGGLANVREHASLLRPRSPRATRRRTALVTGGAGFVGSNLAHRLLEAGEDVVLLDNLSRPGIERNLRWLRERHGDRVRLRLADVRDPFAMREEVGRADRVFHFAAQVAVTLSLVSPRHDFGVNAGGTLNLLEAMRALETPPPLVFTSTNKVYGALPDVDLKAGQTRYAPVDPHLNAHGIAEDRPLDFHSPYGCSKGVADQYVVDYARCFGLPATVFRMSCIYGPRQWGNEEQGWVAHFVRSATDGTPITVYGDGKQVRDILYVGDLVEAFVLASERIDAVRGQAFNVGGGPENTVSLLELVAAIEALQGEPMEVRFGGWRPGDQRYYCSDYRRLQRATGWRPSTPVERGLAHLHDWLQAPRGGWRPGNLSGAPA